MELKLYLKIHGADDLARKIGTSPVYLSHIAAGRRRASPARAQAIEKATGGQVTIFDLRPDLAEMFAVVGKKGK